MSDLDFADETVVVTGAGQGQGRAHTIRFASLGAGVVVNDLGTSIVGDPVANDWASEVAAEIETAGGTAVADYSDVSTADGAAAIVDAAVSRWSGVDAIVNNAGITSDATHLTDVTPERFDRQLAVHARGAFLVTRAAWPHLVACGSGRVVNISSSRGLFSGAGSVSYSAAKGGVIGVTLTSAADGAEHGIRANAIMPFAWSRIAENAGGSPLQARLRALPSEPSQVSNLVAVLAHATCEKCGQIFTAGVGRYARVFIGVTQGIFAPDATPELIRQRMSEIRQEDGYFVPRDYREEMRRFFTNFDEAQ